MKILILTDILGIAGALVTALTSDHPLGWYCAAVWATGCLSRDWGDYRKTNP